MPIPHGYFQSTQLLQPDSSTTITRREADDLASISLPEPAICTTLIETETRFVRDILQKISGDEFDPFWKPDDAAVLATALRYIIGSRLVDLMRTADVPELR